MKATSETSNVKCVTTTRMKHVTRAHSTFKCCSCACRDLLLLLSHSLSSALLPLNSFHKCLSFLLTSIAMSQPVCVVVGAGTGERLSEATSCQAASSRPDSCLLSLTCRAVACDVCAELAGLGASIALRFARAGFAVAICARSRDKLDAIKLDIDDKLQRAQAEGSSSSTSTPAANASVGRVCAFKMDCSLEQSVKDAFAAIRTHFGQSMAIR